MIGVPSYVHIDMDSDGTFVLCEFIADWGRCGVGYRGRSRPDMHTHMCNYIVSFPAPMFLFHYDVVLIPLGVEDCSQSDVDQL